MASQKMAGRIKVSFRIVIWLDAFDNQQVLKGHPSYMQQNSLRPLLANSLNVFPLFRINVQSIYPTVSFLANRSRQRPCKRDGKAS